MDTTIGTFSDGAFTYASAKRLDTLNTSGVA
jgi:hypothetical protein